MKWQPIETAPKILNKEILTYGILPEDWGYRPEVWGISISFWCGDSWTSQCSTYNTKFIPKYWMPIPFFNKELLNANPS